MANITEPCRAWVNQPSTLQPYHKLHGRRGIAVPCSYDERLARLYFVDGSVESTMINTLALEIVKLSSAED